MSDTARHCRRARSRWPMLVLLVLLAPTVGGAAPPVEASTSNASPHEGLSREALASEANVSDGARRARSRSSKIRIGRIFFSPAERAHRYVNMTPVTDASRTVHAARGDRLQINGA